MKYKLNPLSVKTTNSFHINDVEIDLDIPTFQMKNDYLFEGDLSSLKISSVRKSSSQTSKLGLSYNSYYSIQIEVPKGIQKKDPIIIRYAFEKGDSLFSHLSITYDEESECNFIIIMNSKDEYHHFNHFKEHVLSKKQSKGNITYVNMMNTDSLSFYALENEALEDSSITHTIMDLGGKIRLYNVYSTLKEQNAFNSLNTIYMGRGEELLDFNYYLNNIGCSTQNQMKVEGVLQDKSRKNFRGTIDFWKGCKYSVGEESENCILLSDSCVSRSLPQMLCGEENVIGTHGVSSGKVDEQKLFYLMSKGYSKNDAEKLIVLGNFMKILNEIPSIELKDSLLHILEDLLS